ncbi:hypothetical protein JCM8547_005946 [Rhodosporidiobolus lusitaniae]
MYGRGPPGYGAPPPRGFVPPGASGSNGIPTGPRGGLGHNPSLPGRPANLPSTPSFSVPPPAGFVPPAAGGAGGDAPAFVGEKFSLFIGSIVEGVENGWFERILGVAGPVLSFRRPTPAFAFVEYADAESVLRCLEVVNGANIQNKHGAEKVLLVKADEKTRARLDEYEKGRVKDENTADLAQQARDDLANILTRIAAGDPISSLTTDPLDDSSQRSGPRIPQHTSDLAPEDLAEDHRANTLSEISKFRERAVKKAQDKHELNRQIEERRQAMIAQKVREEAARKLAAQQQQQAAQQQQQGGAGAAGGARDDPQSLNKPVEFVQPQEVELDDVKRERERAEREHRQQEGIFRDRERRFEARERSRIQAWEREAARERNVQEQEERDRAFMAERLASWDDDREAERGRESFYIDRVRWRAQRKPLRAREAEADARDRALEAQQIAAIEQQSDSFLAQHADLFANSLAPPPSADQPSSSPLSPSGPANGEGVEPEPSPTPAPSSSATTAPAPTSGAVKLSISSRAPAVDPASKPKPRPTALALEDEEEEGRRKRALIPLSYSDDEEEPRPKPGGGDERRRPTREENHKKAVEVEKRVPSHKDGLWGWQVRWDALGQDIVKQKILPFANQLIVKYLGSEEPEMLSVVEEYLRDQKGPQELLDELEAVLDEDATDFVVKVWRQLAVETELRHVGVDL